MAEDEGYYGLQARWMLHTGDWLTLHWWHKPLFDRAIGVQWLQAMSMAVGGETTLMVRFPSILSFFFIVYLTKEIAKQLNLSEETSWLSGAIVAITPLVTNYAHLGTQDLPLVAIELLGIWALLKPDSRWLLLTGTCIGLGFLLKSFMIAVPMLALIPFIWQKNFQPIRSTWLYLGFILGFIPVSLWLILASQLHGNIVFQQLFGKLIFLAEESYHESQWWYYLWNLPLNGFPWVFISLMARLNKSQIPLLWGFPLVMLICLSVFSTRTPYYGLQILPFAAILSAIAIKQDYKRISKFIFASGSFLMIISVLIVFHGSFRNYFLMSFILGFFWISSYLTEKNTSVACLLLGPWLALSIASQSLIWGNYSPGLQETLKPPISTELLGETINISAPSEGRGERHQELILLGFYTPNIGNRYYHLAPGISWVSPDLDYTGDVVTMWRGWKLVSNE